jgi:hypothetical protein
MAEIFERPKSPEGIILMQETYIIQDNPGGGNRFFQSLIIHLCRQETFPMLFNNRGNAHDYVFAYKKNTNEIEVRKIYGKSEWIYQVSLNEGVTDPLVILYEPRRETPSLDYKRLEEKHPNIKYLFVDVDEKDVLRAITYHFIKQSIYENPNKDYMKIIISRYNNFAKNHPSIKQNIIHPVQLNIEEMKLFLDYSLEVADKNYFKENKIIANKLYDILPNEKFKLNFMDILFDKEKVISTLERMTGRTRNQALIDSYDKYLDNQYKLLETKLPWLLPK